MSGTLAPDSPYHGAPTRQEIISAKNRRLGLLIFQISWMMTFVCLSVVNWQLRWQYADWPPAGITLNRALPTLATLLLFASVLLFRAARRSLATEALPAFQRRWLLALGLGAAFVVIMATEFVHAPHLVSTTYRDVFRVMTGFHLAHALVIGGMAYRAWRNPLAADGWAVEVAAKLWDFVFVAWLIFYAVLYWV